MTVSSPPLDAVHAGSSEQPQQSVNMDTFLSNSHLPGGDEQEVNEEMHRNLGNTADSGKCICHYTMGEINLVTTDINGREIDNCKTFFLLQKWSWATKMNQ